MLCLLTLQELCDTLAVPDDRNPDHELLAQNEMCGIGK